MVDMVKVCKTIKVEEKVDTQLLLDPVIQEPGGLTAAKKQLSLIFFYYHRKLRRQAVSAGS